MPWTMGAFALASMSIVGIPLTSGFVSKWNIALGTLDGHSPVFLGVLLLSSLLSAAYLGPIVYKAYFEDPPEGEEEVREVPWMVAPLVITAAASLLLGVFPGPVLELAGRVMP
jgi:multicomponent Na+:H+ antiporter subunit D